MRFRHNLLKIIPDDLLCHCELNGFFGDFAEEASDCFIIAEASGHGKDAISDGADGRVGNLGSEVSALAFAKTRYCLQSFMTTSRLHLLM